MTGANGRSRPGGQVRSLCAAAAISALLAGCGSQVPAPIDFKGSDPSATTSARPPTADNRGVVKIDEYDAVVAREGDTMDSIAARLGISASELAAYNGYPAGFTPREGDILVLPPRPGGYGAQRDPQYAAATSTASAPSATAATGAESAPAGARWSPAIAAAAIERGDTAAPGSTSAEPLEPIPSGTGTNDSLFAPLAAPIEPASATGQTQYRPTGTEQTHVVSSGETMFSIANQNNVTVGELAYANGMQASDAVSPGQVLIIPQFGAFSGAPATATASSQTTATSPEIVIDDSGAPAAAVSPEPVVIASAPAAAEPAPVVDSGSQFLSPVSGPVVRGYSRERGPARNDGVDFAVSPGAPVRAAEAGDVVLVSKSLGGLGTIILIRHDNQYLTVYGRVDGVSVSKGEKVTRGQIIASVAEPEPGRESSMHFEIRRGAESIDPEPLI